MLKHNLHDLGVVWKQDPHSDLPLAATLASRLGGDFVCSNASAGQAPPLTKMPVKFVLQA